MTTRQLSIITNCSETTLAGLKTYQILTKSGKTYKKYVRVTENEWIDWSKEQRLIEQIDTLKRQLARKRVAKRPLQWWSIDRRSHCESAPKLRRLTVDPS